MSDKKNLTKEGDKNMRIRKITAFVLMLFMVIGLMQKVSMPYVKAAEEISIMELVPNAKGEVKLDGNYIINVDQDRDFRSIICKGSLIFKGNKTLTSNYISSSQDMTFEEGVNINILNKAAGIRSENNIITSGNLTLGAGMVANNKININGGKIVCVKGAKIGAYYTEEIKIAGDVTVNTKADIEARRVDISSGNLSIESAEIDGKEINISGGNIDAKNTTNFYTCADKTEKSGG